MYSLPLCYAVLLFVLIQFPFIDEIVEVIRLSSAFLSYFSSPLKIFSRFNISFVIITTIIFCFNVFSLLVNSLFIFFLLMVELFSWFSCLPKLPLNFTFQFFFLWWGLCLVLISVVNLFCLNIFLFPSGCNTSV